MRVLQRLNPGPGIADFWAEFKRPNPYRWPILGASVLLTAALFYLLSDDAVELDWTVGAALAVVVGLVVLAAVQEHLKPNWSVLLVAALMTLTIMYQFTKEKVRIPPPRPEVTYITTFESGRSDAAILDSNRANQVRQDRLRAEQAVREEQVREVYRTLGRATGLDVDKMEREIREQEAREAAAERARRAAAQDGAIARQPE